MMNNYSALISAISDVGYWRWWTEAPPELFQIEFGGVQIYEPSQDSTKPPSSLLALRFIRPSHVSFITRKSETENPPSDWPRLLKDEEIDPFSLSYEEFALGDDSICSEVLRQVQSEIVHFTHASYGKDVKLAFWAGNAGMRIEAKEVRPVLMSGEVPLLTISSLHDEWWSYWRRYWKARGTTEALPEDFACEVTIPIEPE